MSQPHIYLVAPKFDADGNVTRPSRVVASWSPARSKADAITQVVYVETVEDARQIQRRLLDEPANPVRLTRGPPCL